MSDTIIGIYGASGFGREIMPLAKAQYHSVFSDVRFVFVDDGANSDILNGYPILTYSDFLSCDSINKFVVLTIANSVIREKLVAKCDEGAILCHFTQLTSNIRIGKQFHANISSYVAHDCVIGDYVTFAPGVRCNGNIHIHDHAYIGTGAIIKQGTPAKPLVIGKGAVIGMGAVVTKDVPPGVTVVGNPAKPLVKN